MKKARLFTFILVLGTLIVSASGCSSGGTSEGGGEELPPGADAATDQVPPSSDMADVDAALKDGMKPADPAAPTDPNAPPTDPNAPPLDPNAANAPPPMDPNAPPTDPNAPPLDPNAAAASAPPADPAATPPAGGDAAGGMKPIDAAPAAAAPAPAESKPEKTETASSEPSAGGGGEGEYTVQSGDTLMKIAFETYGDLYKWRQIYEANRDKIKDANSIPKGTVLKIEKPSSPVTIDKNGEQYLIKKGDTLGTISYEVYGTTGKWKKIWKNNRQLIKDPNRIFAGFFLYYTITPKEREEADRLKQQNPAPTAAPLAQGGEAPREPASAPPAPEAAPPPPAPASAPVSAAPPAGDPGAGAPPPAGQPAPPPPGG